MFYVYILKSIKYPKTYVGMTNNIERRLFEHNAGQGNYTEKYKPWVVIYNEEHNTLEQARTREKFFKSTTGRRKLKAIYSGARLDEDVFGEAGSSAVE